MKAIPSDQRALKELGELYRMYAKKNKRGPRSLKELNVQGQSHPMAVDMLKSGELIVQWGAPLVPENATALAILAYAKIAPEVGGKVLMQDGLTIKSMTAEEFKAAAKATVR